MREPRRLDRTTDAHGWKSITRQSTYRNLPHHDSPMSKHVSVRLGNLDESA